MIKNKVALEHKIGENHYEFLCANDSPLGEIHDALCVFKSYVVGLIQENDKKEQEKNGNEPS